MTRWILAATVAGLAALAAPAASADQRNFTYTYDWFTPARGEKEVEVWWTQHDGGLIEPELEFEYGVTDRWTIAPYLRLAREPHGELRVQGWRLEQRYRLGRFGYRKLLPALYLELNKQKGESYEVEGKIITSYLFGNGYTWSNNLIFAGRPGVRQPTEFSYAAGLTHSIAGNLRAGVELFGQWAPKAQHFLGPTLGYRFTPASQLLLTAGFSYFGHDGGAVRLVFEREWH